MKAGESVEVCDTVNEINIKEMSPTQEMRLKCKQEQNIKQDTQVGIIALKKSVK